MSVLIRFCDFNSFLFYSAIPSLDLDDLVHPILSLLSLPAVSVLTMLSLQSLPRGGIGCLGWKGGDAEGEV